MSKRIPIRTCIGCRTTKPKREVIRIIVEENQKVVFDPTGKASGRGAYLCKEEDRKKEKRRVLVKAECLEEAIKKKAFNRAFGKPVETQLLRLE